MSRIVAALSLSMFRHKVKEEESFFREALRRRSAELSVAVMLSLRRS